jgi:hypothetical protein
MALFYLRRNPSSIHHSRQVVEDLLVLELGEALAEEPVEEMVDE